jgi:hypothetical protein
MKNTKTTTIPQKSYDEQIAYFGLDKYEEEETKEGILERIVGLTQSSFVDDNYTEKTIHKLFEDSVEFAMDEMEEYGIDCTEEEIRNYFDGKI